MFSNNFQNEEIFFTTTVLCLVANKNVGILLVNILANNSVSKV